MADAMAGLGPDAATLPADVALALARGGVSDDPLVAERHQSHILDVIEGMGSVYHEHQNEVLAWPYKTFCAKWRRLIAHSAQTRWDQDTRDEERMRRDEERALEEAHRKQWGGR